MATLKVVKVGGKVIEDDGKLQSFLKSFSEIKGSKILVHGGGSIASGMAQRLGIAPKMREGRRITDDETLDVVMMVYGGLVNKQIVAKLQGYGDNALGVTGVDLNLIRAKKRKPKPVDYGWAGDVEEVNKSVLNMLLEQEVVPVFAPLTHDGQGQMLNTNADTIASRVAASMAGHYITELVFCFEQEGVLNGEDVISNLSSERYQQLKQEEIIKDGMIPKIDVGFEARTQGVSKVSIRSYKEIAVSKAGTELTL
ncbi:MAG: acetylglutamate kinase [Balneolaceae bacterium]|nr:acetylglutamate kinase [Balneolaceae bacterium]